MDAIELTKLVNATARRLFSDNKCGKQKHLIREGWDGLSTNAKRRWKLKARELLGVDGE